jgi:tetratricopeptide (TPR) repeat protein
VSFKSQPVRRWLAIGLVVIISLAAWRIGLSWWGGAQRRQIDAALDRRDYAAAQTALANCQWLAPQHPELHLLAARLARRQGRLEEAREQLRHCRADDTLAGQVGLELRLLQIQAGDFADSAAVDAYAAEHPESAEALLIEEAQILGSLAALDVARARKYLAAWNHRRHTPANQVQGILWQATICLLAGEPQPALTYYRQCLTLDPDCRDARFGVAELVTHTNPQEAAVHLQWLRKANPADQQVLYQQALVERNQGQLEAAVRTLDELLVLAPEHVEGLVARGRIALDLDRLDEAGQWFQRAEAVEPKHRAVMMAMRDYLRISGQPAEAERYEQRMAEIEAELKAHVQRVMDDRRRSEFPDAPLPVQGPAQR